MTTPAKRAAARRDPAVALPPAPPAVERDLAGLHLRVYGVPYLIGPSLTGECVLELSMEGASTVTLGVQDLAGGLLSILETEAKLLSDGVLVVIDTVTYVLTGVGGGDDGIYQLTFIDQVAWRLMQFRRYVASSRARYTRAEAVQRLADLASARPLATLRTFIPELHDAQPITPAGPAR